MEFRGVSWSHLPFAHVNAIRLIMYYRTSQVQNDWRKYQEDEEDPELKLFYSWLKLHLHFTLIVKGCLKERADVNDK